MKPNIAREAAGDPDAAARLLAGRFTAFFAVTAGAEGCC